ncbi:uncharacterized protein LOC122249933 [Penaeus japonicus]|uniref:uncharacterized protein LOC122249933 n=1 Tax=Penaeus japonicus TaxID=27405 RepID=UPI001C712D98|nr:uncharacterized protein LOC122249933 [Penaeus japonicus]
MRCLSLGRYSPGFGQGSSRCLRRRPETSRGFPASAVGTRNGMALATDLVRILVGMALAGIVCRGQVARTIEYQGRLYNMVFGYAMSVPDDYDSVITSSACLCRRRCLTLTTCHSVSMVPLDGDSTGRVECRTSNKPGKPRRLKERPFLGKTLGAMHFLETFEGRHNDLEIDGFRYNKSYYRKCAQRYSLVIDTWDRYHIITSVFEKRRYHALLIGLYRNDTRPLGWRRGGNLYSFTDSELNTTVLDDRTPDEATAFYMKKVNGEYKLIGDNNNLPNRSLCMHNVLNLEW